MCFFPTNCGDGTVTFYGTWRNWDVCTGLPIGGGTTSKSINFTVVNVDIAETEKKVCVCDTTSFALTNTCGNVTWEVSPDEPGGPHASGSSIIAGTNCGTWTVIARSTINTNCIDTAALTVFAVADLAPAGLARDGTYEPPTYITCPRATNAVDRWLRVTASSCPGVSEEESCTNLPACWNMTGGERAVMVAAGCINRLAREVDLSQMGAHTVTATAVCSSKTVVIMVQDTNPPVLSCSDLTFCTDSAKCYATVYLTNYLSASDNCEPVTLTFAPSGPQFNKGTNSVTATATDVAGNTTNCTFKVIVNDCENPHITCPGTVTTTNNPGVCYATGVVLGTPITSDNCGVASVNNDAPSQFPVGTTIVTWTVTDTSGNTANCTQTVRVNDVERPLITCSGNLVACAGASGGNTVSWSSATTATDNCAVASVTCNPPSGSWFPIGATTVTCTAIDSSGNSNACTFTVSMIRMTLQSVTFSGTGTDYHAVLRDTNGVAYPTPHWTNNYSAPMCYTRNTHMQATAVFRVEPSSWSGPVVVYGDSNGPRLPATTNTASGGTLTTGAITSTNAFANQVDFLNPMSINWSYSLDYGTNWCDAGTSANQVYVTLANPPTSNLFHTVVHLACSNGHATTTNDAVANTWALLSGPANVTTWDGIPLTYYATPNGNNCYGTACLLSGHNGQCFSFATLLIDAFRANGVPNVVSTRVSPQPGQEQDMFGVNNIAFRSTPSYTNPPYLYAESDLILTTNGIPGQNTNTPQAKLFNQHFIVHHGSGTNYYDPSYGVTTTSSAAYTANIGAWRRRAPDQHWRDAQGSGLVVGFTDNYIPY